MSGLYDDITKLIEIMEQIEKTILSGKGEDPGKLFPPMMEQVGIVFPKIIENGGNPDYWMEVLKRLSLAIETIDRFQILDILRFEARASLEQYRREMSDG